MSLFYLFLFWIISLTVFLCHAFVLFLLFAVWINLYRANIYVFDLPPTFLIFTAFYIFSLCHFDFDLLLSSRNSIFCFVYMYFPHFCGSPSLRKPVRWYVLFIFVILWIDFPSSTHGDVIIERTFSNAIPALAVYINQISGFSIDMSCFMAVSIMSATAITCGKYKQILPINNGPWSGFPAGVSCSQVQCRVTGLQG